MLCLGCSTKRALFFSAAVCFAADHTQITAPVVIWILVFVIDFPAAHLRPGRRYLTPGFVAAASGFPLRRLCVVTIVFFSIIALSRH